MIPIALDSQKYVAPETIAPSMGMAFRLQVYGYI